MCIIIAKKTGVDLPTSEIFDNCYLSNRDGIGISYNLPGENPIIVKGFKNVKKLESMLNRLGITKDHNLVVHFRLATHGFKDQGNCHPFPLSGDYKSMRLLNCSCDCSVAHNGVFSEMPSHEKYSDTMKFVGGILASPGIVENLESTAVKELIRGYCGYSSKLAFLSKTGLTVIGKFEEDNGVFYSNYQYKNFGNRIAYYDNNNNDTHRNNHGWGDNNVSGQSWCHRHKAYDNCTWCGTHRVFDDCFHAEKDNKVSLLIDSKGDPLMAGHTCIWCQVQDLTVKFHQDIEGHLCDACRIIIDNNGITPSEN